jgi:PAS domain S-box-containing protein
VEANRVGAELAQASARLREHSDALQASEALKAAILESALDCIITITDESHVVEFNPAAERTFGHAREAVVGQPLAELIIPPEHRQAHHDGMARYLATGVGPVLGKRIEVEALRADGSRFPAELAINASSVGKSKRFTAYLRDITDRRRAEAEYLESTAEMQRFAYIVSHDLRSPLVNIMGFTAELETLRGELLERLARVRQEAALVGAKSDPDPTELALAGDFDEAIGFIKASIDKMERLIAAILSLSREGRRTFKPELVDMNELLAGIEATMAFQAEQAGATLVVSPLPPVTSDRLALEQIFSNLVDNALKYGREGVPGVIEIAGRATDAGLVYEVRDNGRGIDPKDRERVFDLFRRSGMQDRPGEGIGLATVRSMVRRLGGSIALSSEPGQGSVFTVTLPRRWMGEGRVTS